MSKETEKFLLQKKDELLDICKKQGERELEIEFFDDEKTKPIIYVPGHNKDLERVEAEIFDVYSRSEKVCSVEFKLLGTKGDKSVKFSAWLSNGGNMPTSAINNAGATGTVAQTHKSSSH